MYRAETSPNLNILVVREKNVSNIVLLQENVG